MFQMSVTVFLSTDMFPLHTDDASVGPPIYKGVKSIGLVTVKDKRTHAQLRRPVAGIYSMTNVATFEPYVDDVMKRFNQGR